MSFGLQGSFKFTWILEDMDSWFAHRDYVKSPTFASETILQKTTWCIYLHGLDGSMREDSLCLILRRTDNLPDKIKLYISMFLIMPNDEKYRIDKIKYIIEKGGSVKFNLGDIFVTLKEPFYDEQFKIHCEIINPSALVVFPEHFTACTRLGKQIVNCLWTIKSFLSFPSFSSPFPLIHDASERLEIKGISWERNPSFDKEFHIKIGTVDEDIKSTVHVEGEITLLNAEKETVISMASKHIFLLGGENKIWEFVIPLSKEDIIEDCEVHQTNEELSLLCKFTFYTTLNESLEYTVLPRSCRTTVTKRAEKCPMSNISAAIVRGFENLNLDENVYPAQEENGPKNLIDDIKELYLKQNCCDVVLKAGNQSFPSHKTILSARSTVFEDMFKEDSQNIKPQELMIDLEADTMNQFLLYLYSEHLDNLQWESATKLLHAANKFKVESLKTECCSFIKSQFCLNSIFEALIIACSYKCHDLKRECEQFIFQNASKIFSLKEWNVFSLKNPTLSSNIIKKYFSLKKPI